MDDTKTLIVKVDTLKTLLEDAAIGQQDMDDAKYTKLKDDLSSVARIRPLLPSFLTSRANLASFRRLAQEQKSRPNQTYSTYAERRAFINKEFALVLDFLYAERSNPALALLPEVPYSIDSEHVNRAWEKALSRIHTDPDGAITSARSLLETVCKHILEKSGINVQKKAPDLGDLYNATIRSMKLAPDQQSEDTMRQMLQGCLNVVLAAGNLRNRIGDAHGKDKSSGEVETHHAFLGVSVACTVASFLLVSWQKNSAPKQDDISGAPHQDDSLGVPLFVDKVIAIFGGQLLEQDAIA